jgi:hypothetical protein
MCTCIIYCLHVAGYNMFRPTLAIFRFITGIPSVPIPIPVPIPSSVDMLVDTPWRYCLLWRCVAGFTVRCSTQINTFNWTELSLGILSCVIYRRIAHSRSGDVSEDHFSFRLLLAYVGFLNYSFILKMEAAFSPKDPLIFSGPRDAVTRKIPQLHRLGLAVLTSP